VQRAVAAGGVGEAGLVQHAVTLHYAELLAEDVLAQLLPAGLTVPTGHEEVGHVLHLNLRHEHKPFRHLIGEVLLDKLGPRIRTVVNKTHATGGPFRVFPMELLAGSPDLETRVVENGITFQLDYGKARPPRPTLIINASSIWVQNHGGKPIIKLDNTHNTKEAKFGKPPPRKQSQGVSKIGS
jgi:tRNA G37 N-methylase Trm5